MRKKSGASLVDFTSVLLCVLAMLVIISVFFHISELLIVRMDISQTSRKYMLRMETQGYLTEAGRRGLEQELTTLGLIDIDLSGTTLSPVAYGDVIVLHVKGRLHGRDINGGWPMGWVEREYDVEEKRMSTAKN